MPARLRALVRRPAVGRRRKRRRVILVACRSPNCPSSTASPIWPCISARSTRRRALRFRRPRYDGTPNPASRSSQSTTRTLRRLGFRFRAASMRRCSTTSKPRAPKSSCSTSSFSNPVRSPVEDAAFAAACVACRRCSRIRRHDHDRADRRATARFPRSRAPQGDRFKAVDTPGGYFIGQPWKSIRRRRDARQRTPVVIVRIGGRTSTDVRTIRRRFRKTTTAACCCFRRRIAAHQDLATRRPSADAERSPDAERFARRRAGEPSRPASLRQRSARLRRRDRAGARRLVTTAGRGRIPGIFVNARLSDQLCAAIYLRARPAVARRRARHRAAVAAGARLRTRPHQLAIAFSLAAALVYAYSTSWLFVVAPLLAGSRRTSVGDVLGAAFVAAYRLVSEGFPRRMVTTCSACT